MIHSCHSSSIVGRGRSKIQGGPKALVLLYWMYRTEAVTVHQTLAALCKSCIDKDVAIVAPPGFHRHHSPVFGCPFT